MDVSDLDECILSQVWWLMWHRSSSSPYNQLQLPPAQKVTSIPSTAELFKIFTVKRLLFINGAMEKWTGVWVYMAQSKTHVSPGPSWWQLSTLPVLEWGTEKKCRPKHLSLLPNYFRAKICLSFCVVWHYILKIKTLPMKYS